MPVQPAYVDVAVLVGTKFADAVDRKRLMPFLLDTAALFMNSELISSCRLK
jgi:hypothetical protein